MAAPRTNVRRYDEATGHLVVTNTKGEVEIDRPFRTPSQAMIEFGYACKTWFACMDEVTRQAALELANAYAREVPFAPNCEPR